jgi:hypothetical protein
VPLVDPRTGYIDRAWYLFFLSLNNVATGVIDDSGLTFSSESLIASYEAALQALAQEVETQPLPVDLSAELIKQIEAAGLEDCCSGLLSQVAELQKQIDGILLQPSTSSYITSLGYVTGPASSTDNAIARFDGTSGKIIDNSVITIDDTGNASGILSQQFSNGSAVTLAAGKMWYDGSTGAWNLGMGNGNITQQVGEEIFVYGKASAAITDSPLQIVYHTGVVGASGVITFAPTIAGITDANSIVGIATESLALNDFGRVTSFGVVRGITTNGTAFGEVWADDDVIWYNPVTGNPTKVEPVAPYIKVQVGLVIKAGSGGSGSFQVGIVRGSTLGGTDSNVQFGTLANGDLIQYSTSLGYWTNVTPASVLAAASGAPVTKTADFTVAANETWLINNKSGSTCTVTLPSPATYTGRYLTFKNMQAQTLVSASSNVVPIDSTSAGTAILLAVVGNWATMVSDGTNWIIMQQAANNCLLLE